MKKGKLIWITGLSGAGKTTIATAVFKKLKEKKANSVFLDGDVIRDVLNNDLSHNPKDRLKNAYRISKLCEFLTSQNIHVVCSTMSLFKEIHQMNRKNIANYYEIFVDVNIKELIKRDSKGLYSKAISGNMKNVIGIDLPYDKPENPFLTIENTNSNISIESKALHILTQVKLI